MRDTRVSLVQIRSVVGKIDENLEKILDRVNYLSDKTDIICFPEASLTGYTSEEPKQHSVRSDDPRIKRISEEAVRSKATIIFGFLEDAGDKFFITQAVAGPEGNIDLYRKTHLGRNERNSFSAGDVISAFDTPAAKIGIQICWESHFPGISCKLRKEGAEIFLISYASPLGGEHRRDIWMKHLPARAADNCVFVAAVNAIGDNGKNVNMGGGSIAFDPKGRVIDEYFGNDEHVLTIDMLFKHKDALGGDDNMGSIDYFRYRREDLY